MSSIQLRIFLASALIIVVFVTMANVAIHYLLEDIEDKEILEGMKASVLAFRRYEEQRQELLATQASSIAATPYLIATLSIPDVDHETVYYAGQNLREIAQSDLLLILDDTGALLADVHDADVSAGKRLGQPGIEIALDGQGYYGIWDYGGAPYRVALAPSVSGDRIVGLIGVGHRADGSNAVRLLEEVTGTSAIVVSSSVDANPAGDDGTALFIRDVVPHLESKEKGETIDEVEGIALSKLLAGGEFYLFAVVEEIDGRASTVLYRAFDLVDSSADAFRGAIVLGSLAALLLGILLSFRVSGRISRPIRMLTTAAREYGSVGEE